VRPLVVVEAGPAALSDARGELVALGWRTSTDPGAEVREVEVRDDSEAADAVLSAVSGSGLLVDARADREVVDRLCDDLRRLGPLDHRVERGPVLTEEQHALLVLLARGVSLGEAAERLHLSRRSADRRLAAAKTVLAAETSGAALATYRRRLDRLPRHPAGGQEHARRGTR
jgi:DNA-binding CsgD family transcriptional regulator